MKSHDIAKRLLKLPNLPVVIGGVEHEEGGTSKMVVANYDKNGDRYSYYPIAIITEFAILGSKKRCLYVAKDIKKHSN